MRAHALQLAALQSSGGPLGLRLVGLCLLGFGLLPRSGLQTSFWAAATGIRSGCGQLALGWLESVDREEKKPLSLLSLFEAYFPDPYRSYCSKLFLESHQLHVCLEDLLLFLMRFFPSVSPWKGSLAPCPRIEVAPALRGRSTTPLTLRRRVPCAARRQLVSGLLRGVRRPLHVHAMHGMESIRSGLNDRNGNCSALLSIAQHFSLVLSLLPAGGPVVVPGTCGSKQ